MRFYEFSTYNQHGEMQAATFADAMRQLCAMVPYEDVPNGAWGWVQDHDGTKFRIGSRDTVSVNGIPDKQCEHTFIATLQTGKTVCCLCGKEVSLQLPKEDDTRAGRLRKLTL
jgi:hypothetical protein